MRYFIGNWKMFGDKNMISEIKKIDQHCNEVRCEVAICPPFPLILSAYEQTKNIQTNKLKKSTDFKAIWPHNELPK